MKQEVGEEHPETPVTIDWLQCDLGSFRSIKEFVTAFKERNLPLNILINNAGVAWLPFSKTCMIDNTSTLHHVDLTLHMYM